VWKYKNVFETDMHQMVHPDRQQAHLLIENRRLVGKRIAEFKLKVVM